MSDTRIQLENVNPATWSLLKTDNPHDIPLGAEHDDYWHECGRVYNPDLLLQHLSKLGSPEAILWLEIEDYEGYKDVSKYQLDSREVRSMEKFKRKVCQVLGLQLPPPKEPWQELEHCITTRTINGGLSVMIYYHRNGGVFTYTVSVWTHQAVKAEGIVLDGLDVKCTVRGLRNLLRLKLRLLDHNY
ncbi:hypothetical protein [Microcoleus phage My-WqHQDG]|nr:hypothetical protein [Microcoleus phage My-WqHQDG]